MFKYTSFFIKKQFEFWLLSKRKTRHLACFQAKKARNAEWFELHFRTFKASLFLLFFERSTVYVS